MLKSFIFLEIVDPDVDLVIKGLKSAFGTCTDNSNIHITVKGPYRNKIKQTTIKKAYSTIKDDPIIIQSSGKFNNNGEYTVFLKVDSNSLKKIWWKPDYPIEKYGYNPHITIFRGKNKNLATEICSFLEKENVILPTYKFKLTAYTSKQGELFSEEFLPKSKNFLESSNRRHLSPDILQKAHNLIRNYKKLRI